MWHGRTTSGSDAEGYSEEGYSEDQKDKQEVLTGHELWAREQHEIVLENFKCEKGRRDLVKYMADRWLSVPRKITALYVTNADGYSRNKHL